MSKTFFVAIYSVVCLLKLEDWEKVINYTSKVRAFTRISNRNI